MGPTCAVFGRGELTEHHLAMIDQALHALASKVNRTRKGRVWDIWIGDRPIHVSIESTADRQWKVEDELLEMNLLPEDVPFFVVLGAGLNGREDSDLLRELAAGISKLIGGPFTEPIK